MSKTYEVSIKTQYHPAESVFIEAATAKEAISKARRTARNQGWFDVRNDGRVTYSIVH
jgi:flavin-binding protein dodecin